MKVKFTLSIGLLEKQEETFEYPDDTNSDQLECEWQDWSSNYIDGGFHIIPESK